MLLMFMLPQEAAVEEDLKYCFLYVAYFSLQ